MLIITDFIGCLIITDFFGIVLHWHYINKKKGYKFKSYFIWKLKVPPVIVELLITDMALFIISSKSSLEDFSKELLFFPSTGERFRESLPNGLFLETTECSTFTTGTSTFKKNKIYNETLKVILPLHKLTLTDEEFALSSIACDNISNSQSGISSGKSSSLEGVRGRIFSFAPLSI